MSLCCRTSTRVSHKKELYACGSIMGKSLSSEYYTDMKAQHDLASLSLGHDLERNLEMSLPYHKQKRGAKVRITFYFKSVT